MFKDEKDPKTVLTMAQMTANAYTEPDGKDWTPLDGWNISTPFGWSKDGIRGYVFTNEESNIMVITLKGTSPSWIGSGPTTPRDKFIDNLMFSCCCGAVDRTWTPICDCRTGQFECNNSCLKQNCNVADSYYNLAQSIYIAVRSMYPSSRLSIWMTGHSLGGALASLIGMTNNVPTFAYEAPGDLLYATRIGLLGSFKPNTTEFYDLM
jgi:lipase ATG15